MKNTKRSMLITTVLMVVVLVVAISTSTFAWYTSSNSGTASQANLTAAASSDANIAVGWTNDATSTEITFDSASQTVSPMVPSQALTAEMEYANLSFQTAPIDNSGLFGPVTTVQADGYWTVSDGADADEKTSFFVVNNNVNADATVNMTCTFATAIEGEAYENNDKLVVAVFVNGKLAGVFSKLSAYYVGPVVQGNPNGGETGLETSTVGLTDTIEISLKKDTNGTNNYAEITVKAWLDGQQLTQAYAGKNAAFSFSFVAA